MITKRLPAYVDKVGLESRIGEAGLSILEKKYLQRDDSGKVVEDTATRFFTVASEVSKIDKKYGASSSQVDALTKRFYDMMASLSFLPGGRVLTNAGTDVKALANCYVLPVPDDLRGIYQSVLDAAIVHKNGGGTGYNFSRLRPRGYKVKNGIASGPVSFAGQFDKETEVINSGNRRGANMGILNIDHPDILEFIRAKFEEGKLTNFNVSVGVTDEFMRAYEKGAYYVLRFSDKPFTEEEAARIKHNIETGKAGAEVGRKPLPPSIEVKDGRVYHVSPMLDEHRRIRYSQEGDVEVEREVVGKVENKKIMLDAKKVFGIIAKYAHASGEPGVVFLDRLEEGNMLKSAGRLDTTNPCGEQPLHPYDACNLGSINLSNMVAEKNGKKTIDYSRLEETVRTSIRFMDNVIDLNEGPIQKIEETMRRNRRIGLGVMGWADMLMKLRVPYQSAKALKLAETVMRTIDDIAEDESKLLAKERGVFPNWKESDYAKKKIKVRNLARTTIAPTGSISMVAGVSGGIEPYFGLLYYKKMRGGDTAVTLVPHFIEALKEAGFSDKKIEKIVKKVSENHGSCQKIKEIPQEIKDAFMVAHDIRPGMHLEMQAAFQKHVDNAISKTINMPNSATIDSILDAYLYAHKLGCKGVTIYRDGSLSVQVLDTAGKKASNDGVVYNVYKPRKRPDWVESIVETVYSGCGKLFVHVTHDSQGRIVDIFASPNNEGGCISNLNAETIVASKAIRAGVCIDDVVDGLVSHTCPRFVKQQEKSKYVEGSRKLAEGSSCPSAIGHILAKEKLRLDKLYARKNHVKKKTEEKVNRTEPEIEDTMKCPECGKKMEKAEGCIKCSCGYSRC